MICTTMSGHERRDRTPPPPDRHHGLRFGRPRNLRRARKRAADGLRASADRAHLRERLAGSPMGLQRSSRFGLPRRGPGQGPRPHGRLPARSHPHRLQHAVRPLRDDRVQPQAAAGRGSSSGRGSNLGGRDTLPPYGDRESRPRAAPDPRPRNHRRGSRAVRGGFEPGSGKRPRSFRDADDHRIGRTHPAVGRAGDRARAHGRRGVPPARGGHR